MVTCKLKPFFEKIETLLKKDGFEWYLDEAINYDKEDFYPSISNIMGVQVYS